MNIKEEDMASLSLRLESSTRLQNSGVGKLFALLLKRCWPKDSDGKEASQMETLQHILSWKPMAQYFKNFGMLVNKSVDKLLTAKLKDKVTPEVTYF